MSKEKKPDFIEELIEVSDKCMTMCPTFDGDKMLERPCNCRASVKKILRKAGIKLDRKGKIIGLEKR